uniref:ATP-binding cassette domain-containing protein n=1 Tax=Eubacterium sp. AF22-8LB TaxID=2292232 RepID=UPI000E4DFFB1
CTTGVNFLFLTSPIYMLTSQQQRVAIARALSYDPKIILADEPTGNLDPDTRDEIMDIFDDLKQQGKCIIIVTHSKEVAKRADKIYTL